MATGHRVWIGTTPEFHEAKEGKEAVAFARLAEAQWQRDAEGQWVEGETIWRDGVFSGKQAELVRSYEKGDLLLVIGNARTVENVVDGKTFVNEKLYVNHFSPDLSDRAVSVTMDRSQRQRERNADATQEADQQQEQGVAVVATHHASDHEGAASREQVEGELQSRLSQLVEANRIAPETATTVMDAYQKVQSEDARTLHAGVQDAVNAHLPKTEAAWVYSVSKHLVDGGQLMTWQDAEYLTAAATPVATSPPAVPAAAPAM